MTQPPNYSAPGQPGGPGHGFGPQYGGPGLPPEPQKPRSYALLGGIVVGVTVLALGATLLIVLGLSGRGDDGDDDVVADDSDTSEEGEESDTPTEEETSTAPATDGSDEIGQCLPYEPQIAGDGLSLLSCDDPDAFWSIVNMSYEVDATVDAEGALEDNQPAYDLCGEDYGISALGELWTNWHWVYTSTNVDSLYCIEALGNPDEEGRLPYTPDTGDCFDDSDVWWTVDCSSDLALYEVVGSVQVDDPRELSEDEAQAEATCGGEYYWEVVDVDGRTTSILCGNEL